MKNILRSIALASVLISGVAAAADLSTKAPSVSFTGVYPYDNSGFFVGLFTEGTGGSVAASAPGVNSASMTTTTGALGLTAGYAWGRKASPVAYTLEGDVKFQNFNGNNAGFALQGPLAFAVRGVVFAPWNNLFGALAISNPFSNVPPFPAMQPGVTSSNMQFGIGGEVAFNDVSIAYLGVGSNKVWQVEPKLVFVQMEQLSNGIAVRAFEKVGFPTSGAIIGYRGATAKQGTDISIGVGAYF